MPKIIVGLTAATVAVVRRAIVSSKSLDSVTNALNPSRDLRKLWSFRFAETIGLEESPCVGYNAGAFYATDLYFS
jgi:hypothetical protein